MKKSTVRVGEVEIGNNLPLTLIAGPCVIESRDHCLFMADNLVRIATQCGVPFIFKSSFDKANRSSAKSVRGVGMDAGLKILQEVKSQFGCAVLTDVHESIQCVEVAKHVDVLQIPAFLCRQTDLLQAAAATGKVVNVKKGQFLAPWDMRHVIDKLEIGKTLCTERGASFGYNTLVSDMRAIKIMADMGPPVIFDATHSVQQPGGKGTCSGGQREFVSVLARAAIAVGVAGVFLEVHQDPDNAPSDGPNMIKLSDLPRLLEQLRDLDRFIKAHHFLRETYGI